MSPFAPDSVRVTALAPSPNFGERLRPIDMLLLHYTGMDTAEAAIAELRSPEAQVSAHYVVLEDGGVVQMVPERARAWHAGASEWEGIGDTNSRAIGIEIVNAGHSGGLPPYPPAQIAAVTALCVDIVARHRIRADLVLGHSDVAPARKDDPGEHFPWHVLHAAGIGHLVPEAPALGGRFLMPGDSGPPVEALQAMLALYGYGIAVNGSYDLATEQVVRAFQRHFRRARVDGVADASTIMTLHHLVSSRPMVA
ncbi:N-acetylmuramoyl-L-alanine amidase [Xanthobacter agilis]|jgi:N-acetylmuramoyl-L-alanine amidase|uniref:N-acetylmuramoyl-L-alanine amidase n=1 Tax=Xanthobacter agilis TaxID=47492 RepID=A0ABU0L9N4_XANAG|nr:N-acetylmuramoyl-L-alanine amidase [Xanthobacter agilis]MDQ0503839.1 N-acetylmuramoyl-L-alanine amidase [Xanthobacter agilis]